MARYKSYSYEQAMFIPVHFQKQILSGSFEYALNYIVDDELDLSVFETRYKNNETGVPAYDPAIMLKIVLYAYSRGITSSRDIEKLCKENVIFMALSADTKPHFTTIAEFISSNAQATNFSKKCVIKLTQPMENIFIINACKLSNRFLPM